MVKFPGAALKPKTNTFPTGSLGDLKAKANTKKLKKDTIGINTELKTNTTTDTTKPPKKSGSKRASGNIKKLSQMPSCEKIVANMRWERANSSKKRLKRKQGKWTW